MFYHSIKKAQNLSTCMMFDMSFPNPIFAFLSATALAPLNFLHGRTRHTQIDVHKLGPSENLIDGSNTNTHYKITPPKNNTVHRKASNLCIFVMGHRQLQNFPCFCNTQC